jgi:hypothetical protein
MGPFTIGVPKKIIRPLGISETTFYKYYLYEKNLNKKI